MLSKSRIPFLLSAFACPGAGQFLQKRYVAGTVYGAGFIIGFCWFMVQALQIIFSYYRLAFDPNYTPEDPDLTGMLPPLLIAVVFYTANLIDVYTAQMRIAKQAREHVLLEQLEAKPDQ